MTGQRARFTSPRLRGEVAAQRRVRGSHTLGRKSFLPLTPTLSPQALGLLGERLRSWMARGQAGRGR
jgi:hypothetical protein